LPFHISSITKEEEERQQDPMAIFMYGLKSPESRRQCPRRFKMFLDFLGLEGTIDEQAKQFQDRSRKDVQWAEETFMLFIGAQFQRVKLGEISESTIPNASS
jgi:hypothetical protein